MATPTERTDLKEACVQAAHQVIAEQGVENLSLRDVARVLGVSHQAPYRHYPTRDHLLAEVMRRCFADFTRHLDGFPAATDPDAALEALGQRYLQYAVAHPTEYRLMFGTPWPQAAGDEALVRDARHAFDVLRNVLRRTHGTSAAAAARVDLDALFIWSTMHGLAGILQGNVVGHLGLAPGVGERATRHVMDRIGHALQDRPEP